MKHALYEFRKAANVSRDDLAKAVGTTRQTIYRIEKRQQNPSIELVGKIVGFSGGQLSANDFLPQLEVAQ